MSVFSLMFGAFYAPWCKSEQEQLHDKNNQYPVSIPDNYVPVSPGTYYLLPYVKVSQAGYDALFLRGKCVKHPDMELISVGIYDDEEEYNQEHANGVRYTDACPICVTISCGKGTHIKRRNFTDAELQRFGFTTDSPRNYKKKF